MKVEVVLALPLSSTVIPVELDEGATVADALAASGLSALHPGLDISAFRIGIWGRRVEADQQLRHRDRVELYRPLGADPKIARRERAGRKKRNAGKTG